MKRREFIYLTGCDGTGKTTQVQLLQKEMQAKAVKTRQVWLRFPFFFSALLLVYARLRGYSRQEVVDGTRHGYWDFRHSWLMKHAFPYVMLLDAALAAGWMIYLPLWRGETVLCERFVLDMLVDLGVAYGEPHFYARWPGSLYLRLLPAGARLFILDLDLESLRLRRADLHGDRKLRERLEAFRILAEGLHLHTISSAPPAIEVNRQIMAALAQPIFLDSQTGEKLLDL